MASSAAVDQNRAQLSEWALGWKLLLAAFVGASISGVEGRILGVLMKPMSEAYGWGRAEISLAPLMLSGAVLIMSPLMGSLADRYGSRTIVLYGIPLTALSLASTGLAGDNLLVFYALFTIAALVAPAAGPIVWSHGVASRFQKHRGLALGISMAGISALGTVVPIITHIAYSALDIQLTWALLGIYVFVLAFPLAWWFFFPGPGDKARQMQSSGPQSASVPGMDFRGAVTSGLFWRLAMAMMITAFVCGTFHIHFVAMMTDRELGGMTAAALFGAMGPATFIGRLLGGNLLDRYFAPYIAAGTLMLPLMACVLMLLPETTVIVAIAIASLIGFALGMEGDVVAFLSARYFGLRHYGKIYGMLFGIYVLGSGVGAFVAGSIFDTTGSYHLAFVVFIPALLAAITLFATLARYPQHPTAVPEQVTNT